MKTKEELNALKKEVETANKKLVEPTEEELEQVSGGLEPSGSEADPEIDLARFNEFAERMSEQFGKEKFEPKNYGNYIFYNTYSSPQKPEQGADGSDL